MTANSINVTAKISGAVTKFCFLVSLGFVALIAISRIFFTSWTFAEMKESKITVRFQFPLIFLGVFALSALLVYLAKRFELESKARCIFKVIPLIEAGICSLIMSSSPVTGDSAWIIGAVEKRLDVYMRVFPFQSGFWLYERIVHILCFQNTSITVIVLTILNCLMIVMSFRVIAKIFEILFSENTFQKTILELLFCISLPVFAFSWYLYSLIPFIFTTALTILCFLRLNFSRTQLSKQTRLVRVFQLIASLTVCEIVKPNGLLIFVGICLLQIIVILKTRKFFEMIFVLLMFITPLFLSHLPSFIYEKTYHTTLGRGLPVSQQLAMGLDVDNKINLPGWYDPDIYYLDAYLEKNKELTQIKPPFDADAVKKLNNYYYRDIADSISKLTQNPVMAAHFFAVKFASTWTSADFGIDTYRVPEPKPVAKTKSETVADEQTPDPLNWTFSPIARWCIYVFDNIWGVLVAVFAFFGLWFNRKNDTLKKLSVIGFIALGAAFHLVFETKGMYSLPYFILLTPFAAEGIAAVFEKLKKFAKTNKRINII